MRIKDFNITCHGFNRPCYFPSITAIHTNYNNVVTGIGDNPAEAINDCLEQIAQSFDVNLLDMEDRIIKQEHWACLPVIPSVEIADFDIHYYVSILYNLEYKK